MKRIEVIANLILQFVLTAICLGMFAVLKYCDAHTNSGDAPYLVSAMFLIPIVFLTSLILSLIGLKILLSLKTSGIGIFVLSLFLTICCIFPFLFLGLNLLLVVSGNKPVWLYHGRI
jgi:hypothetical protein